MNSKIFQVKNIQKEYKAGRIKIIDKELVESTLKAVSIISQYDKEIRITTKQNSLIFSNKLESETDFLIFIIHTNDKAKVEIEGNFFIAGMSVIADVKDFYKNLQTLKDFQKEILLEFYRNDKEQSSKVYLSQFL